MSLIVLTSSHQRWQLTGPDAARYLNGQVSNDVTKCVGSTGSAACICNAKGKLEGILNIAAGSEDNQFIVDFPNDLADTLPLRLERYLIADDCEWEDRTDDTCQLHVTGINTDAASAALAGVSGVTMSSQYRIGQHGVDLIATRDTEDELIARLRVAGHSLIDGQQIDDLRIANGAPSWGAELTADTLPKEVGLEASHVSFSKGCYIGQETISRMKTAGKVRQALCKVTAPDNQTLTTAAQLTVEGDDRPCGSITSVQSSGTIGLAMVKRKALESGQAIELEDTAGSRVSVSVEPVV